MSEQENIDLDTYLGVLDREQLQAIIVQLLIKDDSVFDLIESATQFLDHEQLLQCLEPLVDMTKLTDLDNAIQPLRARFEGFMQLKLYENALIVLYAYTNQAVMNMIECGIDPADEVLTQMVIDLENDWKGLVEIYNLSEKTRLEMEKAEKDKFKKSKPTKGNDAPSSASANPKKAQHIHQQKASDRILTSENTTAVGAKAKKAVELKKAMDEEEEMEDFIPQVEAPMTLMKIFEQLAMWRQQLQALGPIFGDALRILKLRIVAETEKQKEAARAAGVVAPQVATTTVAPAQPTKRKASDQPGAVKKMKK